MRRIRIGQVHVRDGIDFECPFCGKPALASLEHYAVLHTIPPCERFRNLSPPDYLAAVNAAMAANDNGKDSN